MRGYLVDPYKKEITEITTDGGLKELYDILQVSCVDCAYLGNNDDVWVDDEGLLNVTQDTCFFSFPTYKSALAGRGLILGTTPEGESTDPHESIEYYQNTVSFHTPKGVHGAL